MKIKDKKILIISAYTYPYAFGGGLNAYSLNIFLNKQGINSRLLCYSGVGRSIISRTLPSTIQVAWNRKNLFSKFLSFLWIAPVAFMLSLRSSIVIVIGAHFIGIPLVVLGAKIGGGKIVFQSTLWEDDDPITLMTGNSIRTQTRALGIKYCDVFHAINPSFAKSYEDLILPKKKRIVTVTQGVNTKEYFIKKRVSQNDQIKILSIGPLINRKGYKEIFSLLTHVSFPYKYTVAYSTMHPKNYILDSEAEATRIYALKILKERIAILENPISVIDLYQESDILLMNSYNEGTPNVILEAMACGVIPVVRNLPGYRNFIIKDGVNGFLFSYIGQAKEIIHKLHNDKVKRVKISNSAARFAIEEFSFDKTWNDIQRALENA